MEGGAQVEESEEIVALREQRRQLMEQIEEQRRSRDKLMQDLKHVLPDLVSSLELSLKVVSSLQEKKHGERLPGRRHVSGGSRHVSGGTPHAAALAQAAEPVAAFGHGKKAAAGDGSMAMAPRRSNYGSDRLASAGPEKGLRNSKPDEKTDGERGAGATDAAGGASGDASSIPGALVILKRLVASCLLAPSTSVPIDSAGLYRRLPKDLTPAEKNALAEIGGEKGGIAAVETALRAFSEDNGIVELEEFVLSGKSRLMVLGMDRNRLAKELPGLPGHRYSEEASINHQGLVQSSSSVVDGSGASFAMSPIPPRPPDLWNPEVHMQGTPPLPGPGPPMFPGGPGGPPPMMGPRGGSRMMGMLGMSPGVPGMPLGFGGMPPMQRPIMGLGPVPAPGPQAIPIKTKNSEDEDLKDLEALLSKKSFKEMQKSKTGEELLDLLHRPTAKETAVAAKFKTKGGSVLKEYCPSLTKEDCRHQRNSYVACEKVHFRRIIAPHTDVNLGDCSFLDTCRHMKTCKYVHYELDPTPDVPGIMMGARSLPPQKSLKAPRVEYCSEVELGEPQWINCDIRTFRMDILGQFGVIMADPPWDIHMELPYGTMSDDEMRNLNVPALQTDGLLFLWVTGRAMELGRECLDLWGYKRVEELIWVKTNQLQRIIRTGRTGHWLNHSKEHCLVGIKGHPEVNRNIDTDVLVAEVRETSRKPDEMYPMLERISPRTRKLELFARMHNTHAGWISLGNQLDGVRLVDDGLRARFRAAYPDVYIQPPDPPMKSHVSEVEANAQEISPPGIIPKIMIEAPNNATLENSGTEEKFSAQDTEVC